jgi:RHS repeat-associated protein
VTFKELANATRASFTYDNGDRLTGLKNETNAGVLISRYTYTYDKVSNRLTADEGGGNLVTWTYDTTYRLTRERRTGSNTIDTTYTYDPVGNRTLKLASGARTTTAYDAANQITTMIDSTGTTTMTYDAAGNLVEERSPTNQRTTHTWDDENRQKKLQLPSLAVTTYTYRWDGLRYAKITASTTKRFVFDGQNYLIETDGGNVLQAVMTNEPEAEGNLVSQRIRTAPTTWSPVYYHNDAVGSTRNLTNSGAAIANTYVYSAFGEGVSVSESIANRFRWVGQLGYYHDDESDDYFIRARYYDLVSGRWMSQDPIAYSQIVSKIAYSNYQYAESAPGTLVDPTGLGPRDCTTPWTAGGRFLGYKWQYGCYCGVEPKQARRRIDPPIDATDKCCKEHDECWGKADRSNNPAGERKKCDKCLCTCVKDAISLGCVNARYPKECIKAAREIHSYFCGKPKNEK